MEAGVPELESGDEQMTIITGTAVVCAAFSCAALLLAGYRKLVARKEDDVLHVLDSESGFIARQQAVAARLEVVDRWGKAVTVLAALFGVLALVLSFVIAWQNSLKLGS
jgi:hypothetical protein